MPPPPTARIFSVATVTRGRVLLHSEASGGFMLCDLFCVFQNSPEINDGNNQKTKACSARVAYACRRGALHFPFPDTRLGSSSH